MKRLYIDLNVSYDSINRRKTMNNPFEDLQIKPEVDLTESGDENQQRMAKRDAIYREYDPMVNEVLDLFIAAHR
jgi:hypothetical protein